MAESRYACPVKGCVWFVEISWPASGTAYRILLDHLRGHNGGEKATITHFPRHP